MREAVQTSERCFDEYWRFGVAWLCRILVKPGCLAGVCTRRRLVLRPPGRNNAVLETSPESGVTHGFEAILDEVDQLHNVSTRQHAHDRKQRRRYFCQWSER